MIEIIQEECLDRGKEEKELPKNIRQIGAPDIGDRIYIENRAYRYLRPSGGHGQNMPEKMAYVLLGKFREVSGRFCVFIHAAVRLEEIRFEGDTPIWNDDSWAYVYKKLKHAYDDLVIVGWAMDICGNLPNLTVAVERLHRTYFGGAHQVLYLLDSLEKEDAFYSLKNGYLKKREGYYVYYDKSVSRRERGKTQEKEAERQTAEETGGSDNPSWKEAFYGDGEQRDAAGFLESRKIPAYRAYLERQEKKGRIVPSYGLSIVLLFVVCGLGYAAFQNHEQMAAMETALMQMNGVRTAATEETETPTYVSVETVEGGVTAGDDAADVSAEAVSGQEETIAQTDSVQTDAAQTEAGETAADAQTAEIGGETADSADVSDVFAGTDSSDATVQDGADSVEVTADAATDYLAQGYYIVQKGDSLVEICRKIYQTTSVLDELCETNGIENPDTIYEGQYLTLPD